jgi:hypothetical protein
LGLRKNPPLMYCATECTSCAAFQSLYGLHPFGHRGRQCEMRLRHACTVGSLNLYTVLFFVYGGLAMD